ncbi:MAG: DUF2339 domain-containing protein, partial [Nitrososphaera sp.]|nr:DUF2339 domain-containing protein [Nitrososphaera sp.]
LVPGIILCAATVLYLLSAPGSLRFRPVEEFTLLFSERAATYGTVIAALGGGVYVLNASFVSGKEKITAGLGVGMIMVLFTFLTVETNDYYRSLVAQLPGGQGAEALDEQSLDLNNLRQLTTSTVWLLYSILILIVGIWKGFRSVRFVAMGLFALSILKIFLFDLSFLETLYRIFSFLALGLILLAVSLMYQRYRSLLFPEERSGSAS